MPDVPTQAPRGDSPEESRRDRPRRTFDEDAELYDRARPGYPSALYDDLAELAGARPGSRVLEVGQGPVRPPAPWPGGGAGSRPSRRARIWPRLPVATWPGTRLSRWWHRGALRRGPALLRAFRPGDTARVAAPRSAADVDSSDHAEEVARSGRFGPTAFRRYEQDLTYTTSEYLELLRTYSGHRALPEAARAGLLACVANLIDECHGGWVTKRLLVELTVSHRR